MRTANGRGWTVQQASHRLLCEALRDTMRAGPGAVGEGSLRYRASAVLYLLLLDHPIDRRGRCRSCRRPGTVLGLRRRLCRIHLRARYWLLQQPDEALLIAPVANDLGAGSACPCPPHGSGEAGPQNCRLAVG